MWRQSGYVGRKWLDFGYRPIRMVSMVLPFLFRSTQHGRRPPNQTANGGLWCQRPVSQSIDWEMCSWRDHDSPSNDAAFMSISWSTSTRVLDSNHTFNLVKSPLPLPRTPPPPVPNDELEHELRCNKMNTHPRPSA